MLCQFPHNIALQNTYSGVLQKSSKHFLISIFFPPLPPKNAPRPLPKKNNTKNEDLCVYNCVVTNVFGQYLYTIYSLTKYRFWSASEII